MVSIKAFVLWQRTLVVADKKFDPNTKSHDGPAAGSVWGEMGVGYKSCLSNDNLSADIGAIGLVDATLRSPGDVDALRLMLRLLRENDGQTKLTATSTTICTPASTTSKE